MQKKENADLLIYLKSSMNFIVSDLEMLHILFSTVQLFEKENQLFSHLL